MSVIKKKITDDTIENHNFISTFKYSPSIVFFASVILESSSTCSSFELLTVFMRFEKTSSYSCFTLFKVEKFPERFKIKVITSISMVTKTTIFLIKSTLSKDDGVICEVANQIPAGKESILVETKSKTLFTRVIYSVFFSMYSLLT